VFSSFQTEKIHLTEEERELQKKERAAEGSSDASSDVFAALAAEDAEHDIKFRTLTWQKATLLLFGEYVCLAILALRKCFTCCMI
jgi:hypothetical protein